MPDLDVTRPWSFKHTVRCRYHGGSERMIPWAKPADRRLIDEALNAVEALEDCLRFVEDHIDIGSVRGLGGDDGQGHYEGEVWLAEATKNAREVLSRIRGTEAQS